MPATPTYGFRYPAVSDPPNVPLHISQLATDVENRIVLLGQEQQAFATSDLTLTTGEQDVPGAAINFTATVASAVVVVTMVCEVRIITSGTGYLRCRYQLDGVTQSREVLFVDQASTEARGTLTLRVRHVVAAGAHTVKLRSIKDSAGGSGSVAGGSTAGTSISTTLYG